MAGRRNIRRPLTGTERQELTLRHGELSAALAPYHPTEADPIAVGLAEMFGSYRSMRQTGSDALAMVESLLRSLQAYPAWAILNVCRDIKDNGVYRDGKYDRRWAPNDADVIAAVRREVNLFTAQRDSAGALLAATVEGDADGI